MNTSEINDPVLLEYERKMRESQGDTGVGSDPVFISPESREMGKVARPNRVIPLPGRFGEFKARLYALNDDEVLEAKIKAHEFLDRIFRNRDVALRLAADPTLLTDEEDRQKLAIALRRFDKPEDRLFTGDVVRRLFSPDARTFLLLQLADYTAEQYPLRKAETAEEVMALVNEYATGGEEGSPSDFAAYCEPDTLRSMLRVLAARCGSLLSGNSSKK